MPAPEKKELYICCRYDPIRLCKWSKRYPWERCMWRMSRICVLFLSGFAVWIAYRTTTFMCITFWQVSLCAVFRIFKKYPHFTFWGKLLLTLLFGTVRNLSIITLLWNNWKTSETMTTLFICYLFTSTNIWGKADM